MAQPPDNDSVFKDVFGLSVAASPLLIGGLYGYGQVISNKSSTRALDAAVAVASGESPNAALSAQGGILGGLGSEVGLSVRKQAEAVASRQVNRNNELITELTNRVTSDEKLAKILDQQGAVFQALSSTIEDPSSGMSDVVKKQMGSILEDAMRLESNPDEVKKVLAGAIRTIMEGGENKDGQVAFARHLKEYKKIGKHLSIPKMGSGLSGKFPTISPSPLSSKRGRDLKGGLSTKGLSRLEQIQKAIGGEGTVGLVRKGGITTAQIRSNRGGGSFGSGAFVTNISLDDIKFGEHRVYMGEQLQTPYVAPKEMINQKNASQAVAMLQRGNKSQAQKIIDKSAVNFADFQLNRFLNELEEAGSLFGLGRRKNAFNASLTEVMLVGDRSLDSVTNPQKSPGITQFEKEKMSHLKVFGLENIQDKQAQMALIKGMSVMPGYDPGVSPDAIQTTIKDPILAGGRRQYTSVMHAKDGTLAQMQSGRVGGHDRNSIPITARERQFFGRSQRFTGDNTGRGIGFRSGEGRINKAVIMDVGGGSLSKMTSETGGTVFTTKKFQSTKLSTIPVLDPAVHKNAVSPILQKVLDSGMNGETVTFTAAELAEHGRVLGIGKSGVRRLTQEASAAGGDVRIKIAGYSSAYGQHLINLAVETDQTAGTGVKLFGPLAKGITDEIGQEEALKLVGKSSFMGELVEKGALVTEGSMLKKGAAFLEHQFLTGAAMAMGMEGDDINRIFSMAESAMPEIQKEGMTETEALFRYALQEMKEGKIDHKTIGLVAGGIHEHGDNFGFKTAKNEKGEKVAVGVNKIIREIFDDNAATEIIEEAKKGFTFGASGFAKGEGAETYVNARGSVERRTFEQLQHQLRLNPDMSEDQISKILSGIYRRKVGAAEHLVLAESMTAMVGSMKAKDFITEEAAEKMKRIGLAELISKKMSNGEKLVDVLRMSESGTILNLSDVEEMAEVTSKEKELKSRFRSMAAELRKKFGGTGEIFLPGADAIDAVKEVSIKTDKGAQVVDAPFNRMINELGDSLFEGAQTGSSIVPALDKYESSAIDMYSNVRSRVLSGKIKGSGTHVSAMIDPYSGVGLTENQQKSAMKAMRASGGMGIFMDSTAFLSQMANFSNSDGALSDKEPHGNVNKFVDRKISKFGKVINRSDDVTPEGRMMRRFFTGLETENAKATVGLATRHPILAQGNVQMTSIFRSVKEVGGSTEDIAFNMFKQTKSGKRAITRLKRRTGSTVNSFGAIAKLMGKGSNHRKAVDAFFTSMHRNLGEWFSNEGGGVVYQPVRELEVHANGQRGKYRIDFGVAAQAFGDFDGDAWSVVLFSEDVLKSKNAGGDSAMKVLKASRDPEKEYMKRLNRYQTTFAVFGKEAKDALQMMGSKYGKTEDLDKRIVQDLMKEHAAKTEVGMVDVNLSKIRRSILNMSDLSTDAATEALALLQVTQEHAVIKGKKLPVFLPFAAEMVEASRELFAGNDKMFRNFMEKRIFGGSAFDDGGVVKITGAGDNPAEAISKNLNQHEINLRRAIDTVVAAVTQSRLDPQIEAASAGTLAAMLKRDIDDPVLKELMLAENDAIGGVLGGASKGTRISVADALNLSSDQLARSAKLNMKAMLVPTAIGLVGTLLVGGVMSRVGSAPGGGASAEDLALREQQAGGSMFNPRPGPEQAQKYDKSQSGGVSNNPHHMKRVKTRQNFNVNGKLGDSSQIGPTAAAMSSMPNMSGGIRVYDDRQPITGSYVERMLGLD